MATSLNGHDPKVELSCRPRARWGAKWIEMLRVVFRVTTRRRVRSEWATRLLHRRLHGQGETTTLPNRFPVLFAQCRMLLQRVEEPAVLSFGCATGEEAQTLAAYLPDARVTGVDLNGWCVARAGAANNNPKINFLHRLSGRFAALTAFDAIFCMAVLQRTENRGVDVIRGGFTFTVFERELILLDGKLKTGGYLFLDHCDFRFVDSALAPRYEVVRFTGSERHRERPVFGPDGRRLENSYSAERCFRKLG